MKRTLPTVAVISCLPLLAAGCGAEPDQADETAPVVPTVTSTSPAHQMPCNPGSGLPVRKAGCPDPEPKTGWVTAPGDRVVLTPFRTLGIDAEGEAYAREHGEEYPFPNDYFDAPDGPSHPLELDEGTVCTGIILVGYREPLQDHVVGCDELLRVAERQPVPAAVWLSGDEVIQVSELYRP